MASENIIESFEYYDYKPPISVDVNGSLGQEFPIWVYNEDIVIQPSKSFLILNGHIAAMKTGPGGGLMQAVVGTDFSTINNAFLHIFDRIDYYIGETKIDTIRNPGISCTMKGIASFENDFKLNDACWKIRNPTGEVVNADGYFSISIPLSTILGFFEDFKQFLYKIPQRLVFTKSANPMMQGKLIHTPNYIDGLTIRFTLTELIWRIPQIKFNIAYETRIRNEILGGKNYELKYRTWHYESISGIAATSYTWDIPTSHSRVKYLILAFQTTDGTASDNNLSEFDLCNLQNCQVLVNNNVYYPRERLNLNSRENKCVNLYHLFKNFKTSYYTDFDDEKIHPIIDYMTFLQKYPIIAIDCSYVPTVIKESLINIKINFEWRVPFAAVNTIHCLMIMDSKTVYNPLHNTIVSN